ncbi:MAG TPA: ATPase, T2SS/T4P/T4SS family [Candidatus Paceibacterota bacterium]|jgi:type IV pilus assembly protein PilB|nr:ATPase, T2SS/T4P/T4SS family [Candidatus Paceibacterota bacterium]
MVEFDEAEGDKRIDFLRKHEEEELAQVLSKKYGVEYVDLTLVAVNNDALRTIPEAEAKATEAAAFGKVNKRLSVAVRAPENPKVKQLVQHLEEQGYEVVLFMCSQESLKRAYLRYADLSFATETKAGVFELSNEELEQLLDKVKGLEDITKLITEAIELKKAYRITRILEVILAGGLSTGASDIHFEPEEAHVRLRYRLDGVLVDVVSIDSETYRLTLSRLKLLSGLKLNVEGQAQDGRFSIKIKGDEIELRTSILPGNYADTLVLRILNPKAIGVALEELGLEEKLRNRLEKEIAKPNGMILTTGPTGSGKTTTLYAFLRKVNSPGSKIITIEDPIEYHLQGIVQTQVEKGKYTFAEGLRSALRQDPDIIMVGEIRDGEVAEVAINAALTGHLVFSTLHTNDAPGSFPRLIDLGIDEKVISSAVNAALAQRLVRKLCDKCKKERPATAEDKAVIDKHLATITDKALLPTKTDTVWDAAPEGCPECHNRGYKGRIGIFEAVFMDSAIEEVLRTKPSEREVATAAKPQGIPSMQEDGIIKVLRGVTSLEELKRVVDLD